MGEIYWTIVLCNGNGEDEIIVMVKASSTTKYETNFRVALLLGLVSFFLTAIIGFTPSPSSFAGMHCMSYIFAIML